MSRDWVKDIVDMHDHYGFPEKFAQLTPEQMTVLLGFRLDFLTEELDEGLNAEGAEEIVDSIIDLCVVAIGTLDAFGIDAYEAWDKVFAANMAKEVGVKPSRPNPLGLPDLIKPDGWQAPCHDGNHGRLTEVFEWEQEHESVF